MALRVLDRDPSTVNDPSTAPRYDAGDIVIDEKNRKRYMYCLFDSGCATVADGQPVQVLAAGLTGALLTVTNKANGGLATAIGVGLAVGVVTAGRYGLVLVHGYHGTAAKEDGVDSITIGSPMYIDANDDGVLDTASNGTIVGWTVAASVDGTTNTVPMFVHSVFA